MSIGVSLHSPAQMVSPEMDRQPGPFSYFSQSTDELAVIGARSGAELTPEGSVYTGFGELTFYVGPERTPCTARVRTMEDGFLPVYTYTVENAGITYRFTVFAARVTLNHDASTIVNMVRVTMHNGGSAPRTAFLTSAIRYQGEQTTEHAGGDNRFPRPIAESGEGQFYQPGEKFSREWTYSFAGHGFVRDQKVLYLFPESPAPKLSLTLNQHYNRVHSLQAEVLDVLPTTPTGAASWSLQLKAGESRSLDFRMPLIPAAPNSAELAAIDAATYDALHQQTVDAWKQQLSRGMQIELPESKVTDTFHASLVYSLMALNLEGTLPVQTVNTFQYHRFYLRDTADFVRMYDATGYSDIAAQVLSFYPSRQQKDGNFLSQPGQYDGWGEALWSYGEHYRRTHDREFARRVLPSIARAVDWLETVRATDPLHIIPVSDVKDNEYVAAHLTGYNLLALGGLQSAIEIAEAAGDNTQAERFRKVQQDYRAAFMKVLDQATSKEQGYMPPSLDGGAWKGTDWGNLLSVTPSGVLDPWDPRVTATLQHTRALYQEGIATYSEPEDGQYLHHYLTIKNTLTALIRGEQEQVMREFYAELLHTSSTHAGFEYAIRPWGMRNFQGNLAPHGWFAADYRNLLRNMMLREEGDDLHLLSAVSPQWIGAGKSIRVRNAPTTFGPMNFSLEMQSESAATLKLETKFTRQPRRMVLHLPWFMQVQSVAVNGRQLDVTKGSVEIPAGVSEIHLQWKRIPNAPNMSYERTVESYKAEYSRRWERFMTTGESYPAVDPWSVPK